MSDDIRFLTIRTSKLEARRAVRFTVYIYLLSLPTPSDTEASDLKQASQPTEQAEEDIQAKMDTGCDPLPS